MAQLNSREAACLADLKQNIRNSNVRTAVADMFKRARSSASNNEKSEGEQAGIYFAALADYTPQNQNLPMRAARSYHKAGLCADAARWYLEAAERYALMHQMTQAIATLRLYNELAPGEHKGPRRILSICREQGQTGSGLYEFLSVKDKAVHILRPEDIFVMFDDATFEAALDAMLGRQLQRGEMLTRTGDQAESIFVLVHGRVESFLTLAGKRTHLGCFTQGDICSVTAYFTGGRRSAEMIATEATELLELPYKILDDLCKKSTDFRDQLEALYSSQILIKQLALAPLFCQLDATIRKEVAHHMQLQRVQAGTLIFQEGDAGCDVYLVRSGSVAMNLNLNGQERLFKTVKSGGLLGEISVAIKGWRATTARAISDCQVLKLDGDVYQRLFDDQQTLRDELERRKKIQIDAGREFVRQLNQVEGDDTCEILLNDIWSESADAK